jgi:hypothetical protein
MAWENGFLFFCAREADAAQRQPEVMSMGPAVATAIRCGVSCRGEAPHSGATTEQHTWQHSVSRGGVVVKTEGLDPNSSPEREAAGRSVAAKSG